MPDVSLGEQLARQAVQPDQQADPYHQLLDQPRRQHAQQQQRQRGEYGGQKGDDLRQGIVQGFKIGLFHCLPSRIFGR